MKKTHTIFGSSFFYLLFIDQYDHEIELLNYFQEIKAFPFFSHHKILVELPKLSCIIQWSSSKMKKLDWCIETVQPPE